MKQQFKQTILNRAALTLLVMMLTATTAWAWTGQGTEASPYQISTVNDLVQLAANVNSGTTYEGTFFKLMNNIDFNDNASLKPTETWDAATSTQNNFNGIGGYNSGDYIFNGTFDGNKKSISGIRIYSEGTSNAGRCKGLFGIIGDKGTVKDLTLSDARIAGYSYIGGIAGRNYGNIDNCRVTSTAIRGVAEGYHYGGIVGANDTDATLSNNVVFGAIISAADQNYHGAIAGKSYNATMTNNYYTDCTVAGTTNATNVGCYNADVTTDNGAVAVYPYTSISGITYHGGTLIDINGTTYATIPDSYYEIPDAAALNALATYVNAGHSCEGLTFKQTQPITLTGDFTPIGEHKSPNFYMFSGTYDGNDQTISGLNVNGNYPDAGLFGCIKKATIKNVWLLSPVISSTSGGENRFAGALVGRTYSTQEESEHCTITNCIVISPTVGFTNAGGTTCIGAIIGDIPGSYHQFTNCYFYDTQHTYTAIGDATRMTSFPTVAQAHRIALGAYVITNNDISITGHPERGFTYNHASYYRDGFKIELSSITLVAETENGYRVGFSVDEGQTWLESDIITVGTDCHDATVRASNTVPIDWATVTDGTKNAPYLIKNPEQLELLARRVNNGTSDYSNKYFELNRDLLYDQNVANNHTAIGTAAHPFCGHFNGAGHVVAFVNISKSTADYQGFFGYTNGATINEILFTDSEIRGNDHVGGIVGYANGGTVTNCLLFRDAVTAATGGVIIGSRKGTTLTANFHNASTYNSQKIGVSTSGGDIEGAAFGARKIILDENIAVDKDVTNPANGFPFSSQKYFRDGLELTVSYTGTLDEDYSVSFALDDTPLENGTLTVTPDCNGKTIKPVFTVVKNPQTITYVKADGTTATHDALPLDGSETSLEAGEWYYVGENITFDHTLSLQEGDVTIILCDGKSMNFGESNNKLNAKSIDGAFSNLTIYGQNLDATKAGTLNIYTDEDYQYTCIDTKTYTQHSGNVDINAGKHYAIDVNAFTLAGGSLSIDAQTVAVWSLNDLTVSGGILDARTMSNNAVLQSYEGDIVLGWTNTTDRIYASSYSTAGKVRIADGQVLKDANSSNFFMGVITQPADIATKTLTPAVCYTFDCGTGAPTIDPIVAAPGTVIAQPATPEWSGHTLLGWYTVDNLGPNGTAYDFSQPADVCLTLYAKWTGLDYTISYDLANGELPEGKTNPTTFTIESADITLVNPVRTGYTFAGWTGTALTEPATTVTIATGSTGNRTYTATWTPTVYPIHYILDGGEVNENTPNPTSYTIESDDIELNNPTRKGYFFLGWTGTELDELTEYVYISTGSYGERTYTANWKKAKDFTTCTALVPNPTYKNGYSVSSFYTYDSPIIKVWDSEGNLLADNEYHFENIESLEYTYGDPIAPCTQVGEHCRVTLEGRGDWIGQLTVDVVILASGESGVSAALTDAGNNGSLLTSLVNITLTNVTIQDRTFYKDGDWNTLCVPFSINDFTGTPLEGATVKELLTTSKLDANGVLTMNFSSDRTAIEAGKPYIVKWTKATDYDANPSAYDIVNPVFSNVKITNVEPTAVNFTGGSFVGKYGPLEITDANRNTIVLLAAGNKLGYVKTNRTLGSFRAYFIIPTDNGSQAASRFELNFADDETTGIVPIHNSQFTIDNWAGAWYDLQGRKIANGQKPKAKGLYIVNGRKVVIK